MTNARLAVLTVGTGMMVLGQVNPLTADAAGESANVPGSYLEFVSERDGHCQNLSAGGQLRLLYNRHPTRSVEYRLIRSFAGDHIQGRVVGVVPPGSGGDKLGCTEVDGRPQDWRIERARFTD